MFLQTDYFSRQICKVEIWLINWPCLKSSLQVLAPFSRPPLKVFQAIQACNKRKRRPIMQICQSKAYVTFISQKKLQKISNLSCILLKFLLKEFSFKFLQQQNSRNSTERNNLTQELTKEPHQQAFYIPGSNSAKITSYICTTLLTSII